jgi:hypothetical protein
MSARPFRSRAGYQAFNLATRVRVPAGAPSAFSGWRAREQEEKLSLPDRPVVGRLALNQEIGVRVPVGQPHPSGA